jgi:two-component system NtrC family response regulator
MMFKHTTENALQTIRLHIVRLDGGAVTSANPVLLVESDETQIAYIRIAMEDVELRTVADRSEALAMFRQDRPAVVMLRLGAASRAVNDDAGIALLDAMLSVEPSARVLAICRHEQNDLAIRAIASGARDVLHLPLASDGLRLAVELAGRAAALERQHRQLAGTPSGRMLPGIIGASAAMVELCRQIERVAPTDASVVLNGESGTGKEVVARAIHAASSRSNRRFVAINCAAIPETLLESELFGYERGAFTGAEKQSLGRIELADRGTLLLDEIGDLPPALQGKLLRFLQERVIERVGGRKEIPVDVRVVCATHRDLHDLIRTGRFREDLFYRLTEITLRLPPLRERDGDAVLLARHFLDQYGASASQRLMGYTSVALHAIDAHAWPGNVRELQNRVKRAVIMATAARIGPEDLDLPDVGDQSRDMDLRGRRDALERSLLRRALARCGGNLAATARLIGVSRPTLYDLLRRHRLRE